MRALANISSWLFHPIWLTQLIFLTIALAGPYYFGHIQFQNQKLLFILVFIYTVFFPALSVVLLKATGLLKSIYMEEKMDRNIPLIITGIFVLWLFINLKNQQAVPKVFINAVLGILITLACSFLINLFTKISLHATAAAAWLVFLFWFRYSITKENTNIPYDTSAIPIQISLNSLLFISIGIAGWIGTARMLLNAHSLKQINLGYLIGLLAMSIGLFIF